MSCAHSGKTTYVFIYIYIYIYTAGEDGRAPRLYPAQPKPVDAPSPPAVNAPSPPARGDLQPWMPPGWNQDQLEDLFWGLIIALDHFKRRYRAELPRLAKALINGVCR